MNLHDKLILAVMVYYQRQSTTRHYNAYALGIYFERIEAVCADIEAGKPVRDAILRGFNDRLLTVMLKAAGEQDFTATESAKQAVCY